MTMDQREILSVGGAKTSAFAVEPVGVWRIHLEPEDEPVPSNYLGGGADADSGSPFLSAAIIARDEESRLPACLESIRNLVDEIVLVDTGSRDRTADVARDFGARVFGFAWCDDFSAARNHALERVRGEWVLQIDADEVVRPFNFDEIRKRLRDPSVAGYYVRFRRRRMLTRNWQLKLFRRHPGLRHEWVVHESLEPRKIRQVTGLRLGECRLEVDHFGYDGDLSRKHSRNLPLLLKRLEHDPTAPGTPFLQRHLSDIYAALGDDRRAEKAGMRAVEALQSKPRVHPVDAAVYLGLIEHQLRLNRDVGALLQEALALFPDNLHLTWLRGLTLMRQRRHADARTQFEKLLDRGRADDFFGWVGYDRRILADCARQCLSICSSSQTADGPP